MLPAISEDTEIIQMVREELQILGSNSKTKSDEDKASFPHQAKINEKADVYKKGKTTIEKLSSERDLLEGNWGYIGSHPGELCCKMTTLAAYCFELLL